MLILRLLLMIVALFTATAVCAQDVTPELRIGYASLANDSIQLDNSFVGGTISIFGVTNTNCVVIAKVLGPKRDLVIGKKERKYGAWLANKQIRLKDVDTFYSVIGTDTKNVGPLMQTLGLSFDAITYDSYGQSDLSYEESVKAFLADRVDNLIFQNPHSKLSFMTKNFFRIDLAMPPGITVGQYVAHVYFIKHGKILDEVALPFSVRSSSFDEWLRSMAREEEVVYGILAVAVPLLISWLINLLLK
jgi:uncharacterized protein (TIGR02186 family)